MLNQNRRNIGGNSGSPHGSITQPKRDHGWKPPVSYETIAIVVMLLIVAIMPLFS